MEKSDRIMADIINIHGQGLSRHKAIGELIKILWDDENIERIIPGIVGQNYESILVATNRRVIIVGKSSWMGKVKADDFSYDQISSIQHKIGLFFCDVNIMSSGNKSEISIKDKNGGAEIAEYIKKKSNDIKSGKVTNDSGSDILAQLEKLAHLKQQGILSESEFNALKQKLLNS